MLKKETEAQNMCYHAPVGVIVYLITKLKCNATPSPLSPSNQCRCHTGGRKLIVQMLSAHYTEQLATTYNPAGAKL